MELRHRRVTVVRMEQVDQVQGTEVLRVPAQHAGHGRVHAEKGPIGVDGRDHVGRQGEETVPLDFGLDPLADIQDPPDEDGPPAADHRRSHGHPANGSIGPHVTLIDGVGRRPAGQDFGAPILLP